MLGNRSSDSDKDKKKSKKKKKKQRDDEDAVGEAAEGDAEGGEPMPVDDVAVPPPVGPRSLYRAALEGAYTKSPGLVARVVDGAAVWIPSGGIPTAQ
jgi:hypothetical protein